MNIDNLKQQIITAVESVGSTITLKKPSASNYNFDTGVMEETEGASIIIKVGIDSYISSEIDGTSVQVGDLKITIPDNNYNVSIKDTIIVKGSPYNIINVEPLYLSDVVLAYVVQIRR